MKSLKILFFIILVSPVLNACQTVTTKIDKTTEQEKKELSQWLNKPEAELKSFYGQPDKVEFLKTRNRNYIYITESSASRIGIQSEKDYGYSSKII